MRRDDIFIGTAAEGPRSSQHYPHAPAATVAVEFTVCRVERVRGRGALVGLATVELDVAGVVFTLQGVQIVRTPNGDLNCKSPVWRHPASGKWLPGVILPPELAEALAAEVLTMWTEQA